jgi:ribosomal protein S20
MPLIKSAKKQLKQSIKKKAKNDFYKSLYREFRRKFEIAIKNKDLEEAKKLFFNEKDESGKTLKS